MAGRIRGLLERLLARRREAASEGVPDSELLRRFTRERDEAAFELLVWRHGSMVLAVCRRAIRDEQLAEDAFQAVFLVLARKAVAIGGNLGGWLFKVARRVSARAVKNRPVMQPSIDTPAAPVHDSAEHGELSALLDYEVARLPERLRRPVILCYLGGHSTEDAACELGCPRGTVLSRLATARKRLAERLTRRGVALPATLAVAGLDGRLVSNATAAAPSFKTGSLTLSTATHLAEGVLRTMSRATILTAMGGVILAAGLATGVGWVAGQPVPNVEATTAGDPPNAATTNVPKPAQPDPIAERRAADEQQKKIAERRAADDRLKKLESVAENLKSEIESFERQIELATRAIGGKDGFQRSQVLKHFVEVDDEFHRATRELTKLEVEVTVLKKMLNDKEVPESDDKVAKRQRLAQLDTDIQIKKEIRAKLREERDGIAKLFDDRVMGNNLEELRKSVEPQREMLARVQREIVLTRLHRDGIAFSEPTGTEVKLDAILRELAALRKEVQELKEQKK